MGEMGFKGFENGLICRGKQYTENTVFEEKSAKICSSGMHYCKDPFDVLDHYGFVDSSGNFNEFAAVEALADEKTDDNKKYCTNKLRIGAKFSFPGFLKACIDFVIEKTKFDAAEANNPGDRAKIGSYGFGAQIGSSGDRAQIGSSGDMAQIGSSGDRAQIGSSGDGAQIGSSGFGAKIGSSGFGAKIGSSGDMAQIGSSGNGAQIGSSGRYAVVMCAGRDCKAKALKGSFITLAEWQYSEEVGAEIPVNVITQKVDGEHIKENVYYRLIDGNFVETD